MHSSLTACRADCCTLGNLTNLLNLEKENYTFDWNFRKLQCFLSINSILEADDFDVMMSLNVQMINLQT